MAEENKRKHFRFTNDEVELVKKTFKDGQELLLAIEHTFLQIPLNAVEMSLLSTTFHNSKELHTILKKHFLPELNDNNVGFGGTKDLYYSLSFEGMMSEDFIMRVKAMDRITQYLRQQLKVFETNDHNKEQKIKFSDFLDNKDKLDKDIYIDIFARNLIIGIVQKGMLDMLGLAGLKELTDEELKQQAIKNSTK
jgi:hypothetical protein